MVRPWRSRFRTNVGTVIILRDQRTGAIAEWESRIGSGFMVARNPDDSRS